MLRTLTALAVAILLVAVAVGSALAADRSAAMEQHMRLMEEANPGMERMMELMADNPGMERMMDAPPFHMPPVHP